MKIVRVIVSLVFLLIAVCLLAVGCLVIFMNPNQLKPGLIEEVQRETGYQLTLDGNLTWSFYPRLGINIPSLALKSPTQSVPFVELTNVHVATEFKALLHGREKLDGNLTIDRGRFTNLNMQAINANLHWQNQVLIVDGINAKLYEGTIKGTVQGQDMSAIPHWNWDIQFSNIALKPLLQDINGPQSELKLSGKATVKFQGATFGKERTPLLSNLSGNADFVVTDGVIEGVDLNYLVESGDALLNKHSLPAENSKNQTEFSNLSGMVAITNGVAQSSNLLLQSSLFITKGNGEMNLLTETLNVDLQVKPEATASTQWEIPIVIKGSVNKPEVHVDMEEIAKQVAKLELGQIKDKASEVIKKHLPGQAGDFLQKILGK